MKISIKQIIYGVIGLGLVIWIVISQIKCNNLKNQLNEEKIKNLEQIDSLTYVNKQHLNAIKTYELEVSELKSKVDSLQKVKNRIIVKKDEVIVSKDVSSAAKLLKDNIESWKN